ncbi:AbfB domain-containing protein [Actinoplanes sp. NBC_00393]|uniref:AbfB domain-containing protein n=1 Tax=Actinoplanes sp. NBC_00393 TaxID=2975953 RepID=UPI002E1F028E
MPDDDTQDGLRVGGWVPPYSPDDSAPGPRVRPGGRPPLPRGTQRRALGPGPAGTPQSRGRLVLAAAVALACATTAVVAFGLGDDDAPAPVAARTEFPKPVLPNFPLEPGETISLLPNPNGSSTTKQAVPTTPAATTAPRSPSRKPNPAKPPASKPAKPAPPRLVTGATIGLEAADRPGSRVRHRNYLGRLDPVTAGSSDLDRADSRFTVRAGRANANCYSLESVNFPGYYLRHRNFEIRLDRSDRSELFDLDATFCTVVIRQNTALALRSVNYPDRHVVADRDRLVLRESTGERATGFVPRSPL